MNKAQLAGINMTDADLLQFELLAAKGNTFARLLMDEIDEKMARLLMDEINEKMAIRARAARDAWAKPRESEPTLLGRVTYAYDSGQDPRRPSNVIPFRLRHMTISPKPDPEA